MASAKKSLQVSMRMLLRGPGGDKAGVLLRQRCTTRLRRWTARLQHHTGSFDTPDQGTEAEIDDNRNFAYSASLHVSSGIDSAREALERTDDGVDPLSPSAGVLQYTWHHRRAARLGWHSGSGVLLGETEPQVGGQGVRYHHSLTGGLGSRSGICWTGPRFPVVQDRWHTSSSDEKEVVKGEGIHVTFINRDGSEKTVLVPIGTSMLQAAHDNDIDLEGACEASLACSTCHVISEEDKYDKLAEPSEEENDMLDLAFGLTPTSRLGCQVVATKELDGVRLRIPAATRNFAVDGFVPKPH